MAQPNGRKLYELYVEKQLSYGEIANRYGVSRVTVMRWIKAAGISPRTMGEAANNRWGHTKPTAEELRRMYVEERLSYTQIAAQRGVTVRAVLKWMRDYDIMPRSRSESISMANRGRPWTEKQRAIHAISRSTPEYREKLAQAHRGEKSHLWRGGKIPGEKLRLQGWEWKLRRKECYERDGWLCQDCGVHCHGRGKERIQAHHILSRREGGGDELENLVTLCVSCHHLREWAAKKE